MRRVIFIVVILLAVILLASKVAGIIETNASQPYIDNLQSKSLDMESDKVSLEQEHDDVHGYIFTATGHNFKVNTKGELYGVSVDGQFYPGNLGVVEKEIGEIKMRATCFGRKFELKKTDSEKLCIDVSFEGYEPDLKGERINIDGVDVYTSYISQTKIWISSACFVKPENRTYQLTEFSPEKSMENLRSAIKSFKEF